MKYTFKTIDTITIKGVEYNLCSFNCRMASRGKNGLSCPLCDRIQTGEDHEVRPNTVWSTPGPDCPIKDLRLGSHVMDVTYTHISSEEEGGA